MTNLAAFAALLNDIPMGCRDAVLPKPLLKNHTINCLAYAENTKQPYNDNLCLFQTVALHSHGTQRLQVKTSNLFNLFSNKMDGLSTDHFQGV